MHVPFLRLLLICLFVPAAPGYAAPPAADAVPTVIYTAREIVTMAPEKPLATAVAVRDGRILGVGAKDEMLALTRGMDPAVDERFAGSVIVPGLIEQHIHPILSALSLTTEVIAIEEWQLPGRTFPAARDRKGYLERLRAVEAAMADAQSPLVSWGFHHYFHGRLTRQDLDAISKTRPIFIWHRSAHEFILNSAALEAAQVSAQDVAANSGFIRQQIDLQKGHFWEAGAFDFLLPRIFDFLAQGMGPGLVLTELYLHAAGVTTAAEPGGMAGFYEQLTAVLGDPDTPLRFFFIPDGRSLALEFSGAALLEATEAAQVGTGGNTAFLPGQVKLFSDGAMFSQLMQMRGGYLDGHHGEWMMEQDVFKSAFATYWDAGYQIHVHQNGDAGLDLVLDALRDNMRRKPRTDHRTTIVHFGFSAPDQVQELSRLGAIISANPYYPVALGEKYSELGIGPKRARSMVRLADAVKAGIRVSLHSDMPMAPAQPLYLMWAAVNRIGSGGGIIGPQQALTAEQALRAVTLDAAHSLRLEHEIGSIEAGKRADFTVLAENPLTVPKMRIKDIAVLGTVLGGRPFPLHRQ
ncbi:MAG: amidohydrolase [Halioglobus sp.]|nr:amidohydrolase [Halioglobus sp.]